MTAKNYIFVQIFLIAIALSFFSFGIQKYPLVDYDEATYAKVTLDTMESGDIFSLRLGDKFWFEKPPIYFWSSMLMVKIFGQQDFAFRIASILFATLSLWLVLLIVFTLTRNFTVAVATFLV